MKKILIYLLIPTIFLNCNSDKKVNYLKYKGKLIEVKFDNSKTDSTFTGYGGEYYPNGNLKMLAYIKNGRPADTVFYYYDNGNIKEHGLIKNNFLNGWWTYYREDGSVKEKTEWIILRDSSYKNQSIYYNQDKEINIEKSSFFKLQIPDTIKLGKNLASFDYNSNIEAYKILMYVVIENQYSENEIKLDTFAVDETDLRFGVYGYQKGRQKIKGQIVEEVYNINVIDPDSAIGTIGTHKKYFEKYVNVSE